ncbi:MAG: VOC family protein [Candidatus Coatesbacteria bacterium]|nr:MAG: VOC family protein [Candidatus Coatesbacteria bacterium]
MFTEISCLAVYATDYERSKRFYIEVLGFDVRVELGPNLCFLVSKSGDVHIYLEGGYDPNPVGERDARLSFFLESEKSIYETYDDLKTAGAKLLHDAPEQVGDDRYVFRLADPDGNLIEASGKG